MILPVLISAVALLAAAPTGLPPAPTWRSDAPVPPPNAPATTWRSDAPVAAPEKLSGNSVPRAPDGHFYVIGLVNGVAVRFIVDTGATAVVLTPHDAGRAGLNVGPDKFTQRARSASGMVQVAPVRLGHVVVGKRELRDVPAAVSSVDTGVSLLGMTFLSRLRRVSIESDTLTLE
jgi:clan AA aspartic protease (TIGR02281 family)